MRQLKYLLLLIGLGFLAYAIHAAGGIAPMVSALAGIGWWYPLAFSATVAAHGLRTLAWGVIIKSHQSTRPSLLVLTKIRLAGESLNYLTFAGPLLGDPAKAGLLSSETGLPKSLATVGVDRYLYITASAIGLVITACLWAAGHSGWGLAALAATGGAFAISPILLARHAQGTPRSTMYAVIGLHMLSNSFIVLEAALLLKGLDVNVTALQAISIEAVNKGLNALFFFLPMQMGVAEGGNAALLHAFKMGSATGLTLGLALRVRALIWSGIGLAMLLGIRCFRHAGQKQAAFGFTGRDHAASGMERGRSIRIKQADSTYL